MQTIEQQLKELGLPALTHTLDDKFHTVKTDDFKGWYRGLTLTTKAGKYRRILRVGDFRTGEKWTLQEGPELSKREESEINEQANLLEIRLTQELKDRNEKTKLTASTEWEKTSFKTLPDYWTRKKITGMSSKFNLKVDNQTTLVPITDESGDLWSIQYIYYDGTKEIIEGGRLDGCFYSLGLFGPSVQYVGDPHIIYIAEGVATALSVYLATECPVVAAISANNILEVAHKLRLKYPTTELVLCADNDKANQSNVGIHKATHAASQVNGTLVYPKDHNDWNDVHSDKGLEAVKEGLLQTSNPFQSAIDQGFMKEVWTQFGPKKVPDYDTLIAFFDHRHPFVAIRETSIVYAWNGTHYVRVYDQELKMFASQFFKPSPSVAYMKEFMGRASVRKPIKGEWFSESSEGFINFKNGVFNVKTGVFERGHKKTRGFKAVLSYDYDPGASCPMFDAMILKVCSGDLAKVENILRFLAYTISGSPCYADKFMVLTGEGSNGKSRFINVIRQLIGEKFTVDAGVSMITKENQRSAIDGKLLCIMEEIPAYKNEDFWEVLKSISTGGYLHADIKFKEGYSFKNVSKFIFTCNKLPAGTDPTGGWYRRFLLIPFLHKFDRSDSDFVANIDEKIIENELPGVFNRVWGAYSRLVGDAYGFVESAAAQQAMEAFKLETDTVLQWIKEFGVTQIGTEEFGTISNNVGDQTFTKKDLYDKYKSWAIDCGYKPVGKITFLGRLSKSFKYDDHPHTFPDGRRERRVRGIRLVDEFSAEAPF